VVSFPTWSVLKQSSLANINGQAIRNSPSKTDALVGEMRLNTCFKLAKRTVDWLQVRKERKKRKTRLTSLHPTLQEKRLKGVDCFCLRVGHSAHGISASEGSETALKCLFVCLSVCLFVCLLIFLFVCSTSPLLH
jgi:hypothetical protein